MNGTAKVSMPYTMTPGIDSATTDTTLAQYLLSKGPLSVSFYVENAFYSYSSGVYNTPCAASINAKTNHAVLLGK